MPNLKLVPKYAATDGLFTAQSTLGVIPLDGSLVEGGKFNGGDLSYKVSLTSTTAETGTITIFGEDQYGNTISEDIAAPNNNTRESVKYFNKILRVFRSNMVGAGNITGNITGKCVSTWIKPSEQGFNGISWDINSYNTEGTENVCTYLLEHTLSALGKGHPEPRNINTHDAFITSNADDPVSGNIDGNYGWPPNGYRIRVVDYTGLPGNEATTIEFNSKVVSV
tara:strand:- start:19214 stop:19885 length:672 start_codon:yes stop_codon:yes gene_type:complete